MSNEKFDVNATYNAHNADETRKVKRAGPSHLLALTQKIKALNFRNVQERNDFAEKIQHDLWRYISPSVISIRLSENLNITKPDRYKFDPTKDGEAIENWDIDDVIAALRNYLQQI